jgi:hypothetical protein
MTHAEVKELIESLELKCLGTYFTVHLEYDKKYTRRNRSRNAEPEGRLYIQISYGAPCTKTGRYAEWRGGKHYLSSYMTEGEIVNKVYVAFKQAVEHEVMEGFKFDGKIVFNPHVSFRDLIKIDQEVTRT